ncbi:hypothetical protein [Nostoc sp. KVJ20]|nr:hypothetical protein [Nostoc sp. KVJ20]
MVQQIQHLNPPGFFDPSHYGFTHVVTVPANTNNSCLYRRSIGHG